MQNRWDFFLRSLFFFFIYLLLCSVGLPCLRLFVISMIWNTHIYCLVAGVRLVDIKLGRPTPPCGRIKERNRLPSANCRRTHFAVVTNPRLAHTPKRFDVNAAHSITIYPAKQMCLWMRNDSTEWKAFNWNVKKWNSVDRRVERIKLNREWPANFIRFAFIHSMATNGSPCHCKFNRHVLTFSPMCNLHNKVKVWKFHQIFLFRSAHLESE